MGNDNDPEDDPLTAVIVSPPSQALLFTFNDDGTFDYTPNLGYTGVDSFDYKLNDGGGDSNTATVTIVVGAGTISGKVFEDIAGDVLDGTQVIGDVDNPGVPGVTVTLWADNVSIGLAGASDAVFVQAGLTNPTTTDANGDYSFPNLPPGDFYVVVDSKTIAPAAGLEHQDTPSTRPGRSRPGRRPMATP